MWTVIKRSRSILLCNRFLDLRSVRACNKQAQHQKILAVNIHNVKLDVPPSMHESNKPVNKYIWRTHTCGELSVDNVDQNVILCGWVDCKRHSKFLLLRDSYGITQIYIPHNRKDLQTLFENLSLESVICVKGKVQKRPVSNENLNMKTGHIEVFPESIEVLNSAKKILPFYINDHIKSNQDLSLQYRYIYLRHQKPQQHLRLRSNFLAEIRNYLIKQCEFVDIETPTLFRNTPGGAQEFIVPTQRPGCFYSLVQSPQQLKQLLMVGGCDRYFQIAKCYRDETSRSDRQPEFTQLDIEMSFVDCKGVMKLIEDLLINCWPTNEITVPFKSLTYDDAMELYGTDKPDLRLPQLKNVTNTINLSSVTEIFKRNLDNSEQIYIITFPEMANALTKSTQNQLKQIRNKYYPNVHFLQMTVDDTETKKDLISKLFNVDMRHALNLSHSDVVFLAAGDKSEVQNLLAKVRAAFANNLEQLELLRLTKPEFVWITDFPLFSVDKTTGTLKAMHHPFTQPHPKDVKYLDTNPEMVRSLSYDLVLNGVEIGGGSIRIHDVKMQRQILSMLNIPCNSLSYMLDALECGAPPHGGIALGIDRIMAILCNEKNLKNVIAFPKTMEGNDLLSNAPSKISEEELKLYHITTNNK